MDFKDVILQELEVMMKKEYQDRQIFKGRAYAKVIAQIRSLEKPIKNMEDLAEIKGVGEGIKKKLQEIIDTGHLQAASVIRHERPIAATELMMTIYGIGPVKAKSLVDAGIKTLEQLQERLQKEPKLLNEKQKIGLKYVHDLNLRIPRKEMEEHEAYIASIVKQVKKDFHMDVVGSYRRGKPDSGDIDVLLALPQKYDSKEITESFQLVCKRMQDEKYITDVLALGDKKCMAICRLNGGKARRIDLLMTPVHEYPYALLYFTGSDKFNVAMRKHALSKGYTMNEHGMARVSDEVPEPPSMNSEKDIFTFLKYDYVTPNKRENKKNV